MGFVSLDRNASQDRPRSIEYVLNSDETMGKRTVPTKFDGTDNDPMAHSLSVAPADRLTDEMYVSFVLES